MENGSTVTVEIQVPAAPHQPGGALPLTGAAFVGILVLAALAVVCIGVALVRVGGVGRRGDRMVASADLQS